MGNLLIDKSKGKAFLNKSDLNLNPNEFEIIWLLASTPEKQFSTDEMINAIFRSGKIVSERSSIERMTQNIQKKSGIEFIQKTCNDRYQFYNQK